MLLRLLIAWLLLFPPAAQAQQVYKQIDENGKVSYSTTPQNESQKPANLPPVYRENINQRIDKIRASTPANCEKHGGIDCSSGADQDGSVICLDGYRDSVLPFRFQCLESRLQLSKPEIVDADGNAIHPSPAKTAAGEKKPSAIRVSIRNLSPVKALKIEASILLPEAKQPVPAAGPEDIEPYGVAEYSAPLDKSGAEKVSAPAKKLKAKASCKNCSAVLEAAR